VIQGIIRFPAAASKNESKQQSVVWIHFYPAWKAGRVERDISRGTGLGRRRPKLKKGKMIQIQ
jgi:hypothetical protein